MKKTNVLKVLITISALLISIQGKARPAMTDRLICHDANLAGVASVVVSVQVGLGPVFTDEDSKFRNLALGERITLSRFTGGFKQNMTDFFAKNYSDSIQFEFGMMQGSQIGGDGYSPAEAKYTMENNEKNVSELVLSEVDKNLIASLTQTKGGHTQVNLLKCEISNH